MKRRPKKRKPISLKRRAADIEVDNTNAEGSHRLVEVDAEEKNEINFVETGIADAMNVVNGATNTNGGDTTNARRDQLQLGA